MDTEKKQKIIILFQYAVILLFLFIIGSGNVISPLYGDINMLDEGQYGAWLMHLFNGGHLYKDAYGAYGPLYIYPIYILTNIFPPTVFLIRIVYIVLNVLFAVGIVQIILRELKFSYRLQLMCITLLFIIPDFGMRQGMGLLSLLFIYKAVEKNNLFRSIMAGAILALTFLTSSDMGIFALLISIFYLTYGAIKTNHIQEFLKKILLIFLSYLFVFFIFYLWSNSEGWFFAYIHTILSDIRIYSSIDTAIGRSFPNAFYLMPHALSVIQWIKYIVSQQMLLYWVYLFYIISFMYFLIKILLNKFKKEDHLVLIITIFGFLLSTILIGRTGHINFTLAPVFILFVYFLRELILKFYQSKNADKSLSFSFIVLILFFSLRFISIYRPHFIKILSIPHAIADKKAELAFVGPIAISQKQTKFIQEIQSFVKTHTNKNDSIYFFSNDPMLYLLVDKNNPTKYDLPEVANSKDKRLEVLQALTNKKPKYIIYDVTSFPVDGVSNYERLPEVASFIKKNYQKTKLDNFIMYTRISSQ